MTTFEPSTRPSPSARVLTPEHRRRIQRALGDTAYKPVFSAIRKRIEGNGLQPFQSLKLPKLEPKSREALADLFGWPVVKPNRVTIRYAELDAALRSSSARAGVLQTLEALGGPLVDRKAKRTAALQRRARVWENAHARVTAWGQPALAGWLEHLRRAGLVRRASTRTGLSEDELLGRALNTVEHLPAMGIPLSVLAARVTGDPHALDPNEPLASLVLAAAVRLAGWRSAPSSAEGRRRLWSEVGVFCDPLSTDVLVFGLRPLGDSVLSRHLRENAALGEPTRVTQRQLLSATVSLPAGTAVYVCENPAIVLAAADRLGPSSAPLVCLDGSPSTAVICLLEQLQRAGAQLRFQVDFDCGGLVIGNYLTRRLQLRPWRLSVDDYQAALPPAARSKPLDGRPPRALWDARLRERMLEHGTIVFEEQLVEPLLRDLQRGQPLSGALGRREPSPRGPHAPQPAARVVPSAVELRARAGASGRAGDTPGSGT